MDYDKEHNIIRYLNGKYTASEEQELLAWINESSEHKTLFFKIKDTFDASLQIEDCSNSELIKLYQILSKHKKIPHIIPLWQKVVAIAAVLFVGIIVGTYINYLSFSHQNKLITFSVPLGSKSCIELSDGTKVNLNSGSILTCPASFSSKERIISLTGEGYFEVKSDKLHPFIVKTKDFNVKVTGTKFDICTYPDDYISSTTLVDGSVILQTKSSTFKMKPGEKAIFNRNNNTIEYSLTDVKSVSEWKNGNFVFRNVPFPELIKRLERWYNVKINYQDVDFDSLYYSGQFKNQETIWQVLDAIKLTAPLNYKQNNSREFNLIYKPMKK